MSSPRRHRAGRQIQGQAASPPSGLRLDIPGRTGVRLEHLILDYNGTLGLDGSLLPGVRSRLRLLSRVLQVHIVTADTHGSVRSRCAGLACMLHVLPPGPHDLAKRAYAQGLGALGCVCVGNGANDAWMLRAAAVGIAVIGPEGAAVSALQAADIVVVSITHALDLLLNPLRLVATLRL